jgi:hypothetical protein
VSYQSAVVGFNELTNSPANDLTIQLEPIQPITPLGVDLIRHLVHSYFLMYRKKIILKLRLTQS